MMLTIKRTYRQFKNFIMNNKKISLIVLGSFAVILFILLIYVYANTRLSNVERNKIEETSNTLVSYIDVLNLDIENNEKYVIYVLKYIYYEDNKQDITVDEVKDKIIDIFGVKISKDELTRMGVTPNMLESNISFDSTNNVYNIFSNGKSYSDIAKEKIIDYDLIDVKKKGKNKYTVSYKKYEIDNPYEILNYYEEQNRKNLENSNVITDKGESISVDIEKKEDNTNVILGYLKGENTLKELKSVINKEDINKFGKEKGKITITYVYEDDNLVIKKVK